MAAVEGVAPLEADDLHVDEQTVGRADRIGDLFVAEHFGSAVLVIDRCFHRSLA
jgi:hypothetical protein